MYSGGGEESVGGPGIRHTERGGGVGAAGPVYVQDGCARRRRAALWRA